MDAQIPPPLPLDRSTTWWQRNWKWLIPASLGGIALFAGFIMLIVTIVFGMMKSSHAYKEALAMARADLSVKEALGSPIKEGFLVMGNINVIGSSGHADLAIPVSGPEGSGTIYVVASKSAADQWTISRLVVDIKDTNERIDLLAKNLNNED
jgi:hypothetical protein